MDTSVLTLSSLVLIPDLWGESSDGNVLSGKTLERVLIPDLWGESSDIYDFEAGDGTIVLIPDLWGESSDEMTEELASVFES